MDKSLYGELFMTLYPGLFRLAHSMLRQEADAQDAVQQAAEKAWKAADRIKPETGKTYITRIVINECRNIQRHRHRIVPANNPESIQSAVPDDAELKVVIDGLPETLRLPLLLRYMEGYSEKETAAALKITMSALKARLRRARARLREAYMDIQEEET